MPSVQEHVSLAKFTTFHIGGPADFFCKAESADQLVEAIQWAQEKKIPFFVLGAGANILVGDKGFRGLVIKNESSYYSQPEVVKDGSMLLTAESGVVISDLIEYTIEKGMSGLEHFAGIPSTVGGALWQNLHFLSPDRNETVFIGSLVRKAEIFTENNERKTVDGSYFQFDYDESILHHVKDIVLTATLIFKPENSEIIRERADANISWRKEKHPENAASCSAGSVFKKLEGYGAGRLIEKVGLKGRQVGGAQISGKHANFIINTGNATAADVRELISLVQETVKKELGLSLEPEISFIGEF